MHRVDHLTGPTITRLMCRHGKTIQGLARAMNVTQIRVRYVRTFGVKGEHFAADWIEGITGQFPPTWAVVARAYLPPQDAARRGSIR